MRAATRPSWSISLFRSPPTVAELEPNLGWRDRAAAPLMDRAVLRGRAAAAAEPRRRGRGGVAEAVALMFA